MKHLKFLMVALTMLMGVSFTSCLDSDSESTYDAYGYFRTQSYMGSCLFVDLEGNRYYPTAESLAAMTSKGFKSESADLVILYFKWADELGGNSSTAKGRTIELVSVNPIDSYRTTQLSSEAELENYGNAPIVTLTPTVNGYGGSGTLEPMLYGSQMVVLPVAWKMENKAETLAQHKFTLAYVDEVQQNSSELVLYLCHDKGTDEKTDITNVSYKAFDIQSFMETIKHQTGSYPSKVTIKAKANTDGTTMPDDYTKYEINSSALNK